MEILRPRVSQPESGLQITLEFPREQAVRESRHRKRQAGPSTVSFRRGGLGRLWRLEPRGRNWHWAWWRAPLGKQSRKYYRSVGGGDG